TEINVGDDVDAEVVDRVPAEQVPIELERRPQRVISLVCILLGDGRVAFVANVHDVEVPRVLVVVDKTGARTRLRYGQARLGRRALPSWPRRWRWRERHNGGLPAPLPQQVRHYG